MARLIEQGLQDLRFGVRTLVGAPGFALLAIVSLALGIMATTAMYSVVRAVVLDPFPYKDVDNLMSIRVADPGGPRRAHVLHDRPVPRVRPARHDLRRRHRVDHQRRHLDRQRRPAAAARQSHHDQHLRRDGRAAAAGPRRAARRRRAGRRAGRGARVQVLAAAVRRRAVGRRSSDAAQRRQPHRGRRDAQALHVARRRRLRARRLRAGQGHRRRQRTCTCSAG